MAQSSLVTFLATLLVGGAAGAGSALFLQKDTVSVAQEEALAPDAVAELRAAFEQLQQRQTALETSSGAMESSMVAPARRSADGGDLEALVARMVAEALDGQGAGASPAGADTELDGLSTEDLYAKLQDPDLDFEAREMLWQAIRDGGRSEEIVALLEARAEDNPNDPEAAVELGEAYLQRIQEVGNGPLAGVLATQADTSFDRALELDPQHWDARFNKAVALSFWPPVMGKQRSAIAEFETLVAQQSSAVSHPGHAQTHLLLGNMYQQIGETDKAVAAWTLGAQLFPDNADLTGQLELMTNATGH